MKKEIEIIPYKGGNLRLVEIKNHPDAVEYQLRLEEPKCPPLTFRWHDLASTISLSHPNHGTSYLSAALRIKGLSEMPAIGRLYAAGILSPSQPVALSLINDNYRNITNETKDVLNQFPVTANVMVVQTVSVGPNLECLLIEPRGKYPNTLARRYGSCEDFLELQVQLMDELTTIPTRETFEFDWFGPELQTFLMQYWESPFSALLTKATRSKAFKNNPAYLWLTGLISGYPLDSCLQLQPKKL